MQLAAALAATNAREEKMTEATTTVIEALRAAEGKLYLWKGWKDLQQFTFEWPFWVSAQIQLNFSLLFVNEITRGFLHVITS